MKTKYLKFGTLGFLVGLLFSYTFAISDRGLGAVLGWLARVPYDLLPTCSGEGCIINVIIVSIFWPVFCTAIGLIIAKYKN